MKKLLLTTAILAAIGAPPANSAMLTLEVFDNGSLEGSTTATDGTASLIITSDPAFDVINLSAGGSPFLTGADLTSAVLNVTSSSISSARVLTIDVLQTGLSVHPSHVDTTFTVNNLVGLAGATTESAFVNGAVIAAHTFPLGTIRDSLGPFVSSVPLITSDEQQYVIGFRLPDQSVQDTIAMTSKAIPEPATWVMLLLGAAFMTSGAAFRKRLRYY